MNIVKIGGSTAQQMFQYAFYLELCRHDAGARLDVSSKRWIKSQFKLPYFLEATSEQLAHFGKGGLINRMKSFWGKERGEVLLEPPMMPYCAKIFDKIDTYFDGSWVSPRYFQNVAQEVCETFSVPENKLPASSKAMIAMLSRKGTVAVHIHRPGDKNNTCTPDYYNWAIANVLSAVPKAHFYVFTTDVEWSKTFLNFQGAAADFVVYPADKETSLLPYLYRAEHNIMAATLISWWAAWLNAHADKIVIAPDRWPKNLDYPDLIPIYWITIPTT